MTSKTNGKLVKCVKAYKVSHQCPDPWYIRTLNLSSMARVWPVRFLIILGLQTLGHVYYSPLLSMLRHKWLCLFSAIKNLFLCQFAMGVR